MGWFDLVTHYELKKSKEESIGYGVGDGFEGSGTPHRKRGSVETVACWRRCAELSGPWLVGGVGGGAAPLFFLVVAAAVSLLLYCRCCSAEG